MRALFVICFLIAMSLLRAGAEATPDPGVKVRSLKLVMTVSKIEPTADDGLRIIAEAKTKTEFKNWGLVLTIPGGRLKTEDPTIYDSYTHRRLSKEELPPVGSYEYRYSFPVFLEPSQSGAAGLDRLLTLVFGTGTPATIFKPRGYSGSASTTPDEFARKGGRIFLGDPGIDGTPHWMLTIELDTTAQRIFTLVIEELRG